MSRFCNKHIHERSREEIQEFMDAASKVLETHDPRTTKGKSALRQKQRCQEELRRREAKLGV